MECSPGCVNTMPGSGSDGERAVKRQKLVFESSEEMDMDCTPDGATTLLPAKRLIGPAPTTVDNHRRAVQRLFRGYDVQVDGVYNAADLDCAVCCTPAIEGTMLTACGHVFHQECIETALARDHACPLCRQPVPWESVRPISEVPAARYLRSTLLALPVKCVQGCGMSGIQWEKLRAHIEDTCPLTQLRCTCASLIARRQIDSHAHKCREARIECELCTHQMLQKEWGQHIYVCPAVPLPCPHCQIRIPREGLANHLRTECSGMVSVSLFLKVCDRAHKGRSVLFAPVIADYTRACNNNGHISSAHRDELEAELLRQAELVGRPVVGEHWRSAFREELQEYSVYVRNDAVSAVQVFVKGMRTVTLDVLLDGTVADMLELLQAKTGDRLRGRDLGLHRDEAATLRECGVQRESTFFTRRATSF